MSLPLVSSLFELGVCWPDPERYAQDCLYLCHDTDWCKGYPLHYPDGSKGHVASDPDQLVYYPWREMLGTVGPSCDSWNGGITEDGPTLDGGSGGFPVRPCDASAGRSATFQFEFAGSVLRELGREGPAPSPRYDPREIPLMDRVRPRREDDFHVMHPKWHTDLLSDDNDS